MDWISYSGTFRASFTISTPLDWIRTPVHLGCAQISLRYQDKCIYVNIDRKESFLWKLKLEQTVRYTPTGGTVEPLETISTFELDADNTSNNKYLSYEKIRSQVKPDELISMEIILKVIECEGLINSPRDGLIDRIHRSVDATMVVENKELRVNKNVLSLNSSYFDTLFNENKEKFVIDDVNYDDFVVFLRIIYNIHPDYPLITSGETILNFYVKLLELADRFQVRVVKMFCENAICHLRPFNVASAYFCQIMDICEKFTLSQAQAFYLQKLDSRHTVSDVVGSAEFRKLSYRAQAYILIIKRHWS